MSRQTAEQQLADVIANPKRLELRKPDEADGAQWPDRTDSFVATGVLVHITECAREADRKLQEALEALRQATTEQTRWALDTYQRAILDSAKTRTIKALEQLHVFTD